MKAAIMESSDRLLTDLLDPMHINADVDSTTVIRTIIALLEVGYGSSRATFPEHLSVSFTGR